MNPGSGSGEAGDDPIVWVQRFAEPDGKGEGRTLLAPVVAVPMAAKA